MLFSNNKTAQWLNEKSFEDREALLKKARKIAPEFKDLYKQRRRKLLEDRAKVLCDKQLALRKKKFREKEKLTEEIIVYGIWQHESQVLVTLTN